MSLNSDSFTILKNRYIAQFRYQFEKRPLAVSAILIVSLIVVVILFTSLLTDSADNGMSKLDKQLLENVTPVTVVAVIEAKFDVFQYGLGIVKPFKTVDVSSRVDGQLMNIAFKEGQLVEAGDLLAEIDPEPFQIQLKLASEQLKLDKALLNTAQQSLTRYRKLLKQDSISLQLVENKELQVRQYQSQVQTDLSALTTAKLKLKYAQIKAPISGRVGFRQIDAGNIVRALSTQGIILITQLDPISVVFPIPEDGLPRVIKLLASGETVTVDIYDRGLKKQLGQGYLLATDNQIDPTTGTIKLKAKLANPDGRLFANQFVNVKMTVETRPQALILPTAAIQRGVPGQFVYVVGQDNTVKMVPIKTGPSQGNKAVIESGVVKGDVVVVEGADRLRDGEKVNIIDRKSKAEDKVPGL